MMRLLILAVMLSCFGFLSAEMIYDDSVRTSPCNIRLPDLRDHNLSLSMALSHTEAKKNCLMLHIVNSNSDTLSVTLSPKQIKDPLYDREEFGISLRMNGIAEEYRAKIPDSKYLSGGIVAFTLETNSGRHNFPCLALLSGTSHPSPFFQTPPDSPIAAAFLATEAAPVKEIIISSPNLSIHRTALRFTPSNPVFSAKPLSESEIADRLQGSDPYCGYWTQLDYDTDGSLLRPGGRYTIALIPAASGVYDIIYIDGAQINPGQWHSGMTKGKLSPLSHEGIFAVEWIDATGEQLPCHAEAQFIDRNALTITFPELNSSLRFLRSR